MKKRFQFVGCFMHCIQFSRFFVPDHLVIESDRDFNQGIQDALLGSFLVAMAFPVRDFPDPKLDN